MGSILGDAPPKRPIRVNVSQK